MITIGIVTPRRQEFQDAKKNIMELTMPKIDAEYVHVRDEECIRGISFNYVVQIHYPWRQFYYADLYQKAKLRKVEPNA